MSALRVGVIGCGDISALHLDAIAQWADAELVGVCDTDPARLAAAVAATGAVGYAGHRTLLDEGQLDLVHVTTPHATHAAIAVDALDRGIHVIVEKPLAHDRAGGDQVLAAAAASSARIAVCFQNRYNATSQRAHEILASGELGRVLGAAATVMWWRPPAYYLDRPWRGTWAGSGGGLLMNQAIHTLDLLQWLVGDVVSVTGSAHTRVLADVIEVEDTAEMMLMHEGGARSVFYATLANVTNAPITLDITAEHGTLSLRGDLTVARTDGSVEVVSERTTATGERAYWGASHALLIHDFYRSIGEPGRFWIDAAEANKTLAVIQDLYDQTHPARGIRHRLEERSMTT